MKKVWALVMLLIAVCFMILLLASSSLVSGFWFRERKNPVLFVHGWLGGAWNWFYFKNQMIRDGWDEDELYALRLNYPFDACSTSHTEQIQDKVEEIRRETGKEKVDIVAHSLGGSDSLNYIRYKCGYKYVDKLVTIGGANKMWVEEEVSGPVQETIVFLLSPEMIGLILYLDERMNHTLISDYTLIQTRKCWENFNQPVEIEKEDETPALVRYTSIISKDDGIVANEASYLKGARNIYVEDMGHLGLLLNKRVVRLAEFALKYSGRNGADTGGYIECD